MVIQEAFTGSRPVNCGNIGGMAQKITPWVSGLHFPAGSPGRLAATIVRDVTDPTWWANLCCGAPRPPTIEDTMERLMALY